MMKKTADTDHPVHPLIAERWSPRAFADRPVDDGTLQSLLEAARWAPSSYNEQPWAFLVGRRGQGSDYERLLETLVPFNQDWASAAPVLILSVAKRTFERNGKPNRHAFHDVGLAVSQLTLEATSRGLAVHQMAGFDPEKARQLCGIPDAWEAVAAIAIGYPGEVESLPEAAREREAAPRSRKPFASIVFGSTWGESAL